jgi:hypothetical protein
VSDVLAAAAWALGYVLWSYAYYQLVDPLARRRIGARLRVRIVWAYDARQFLSRKTYRRWHWGLANASPESVAFNEFVVQILCVAIVNIIAGTWPAALLYVALTRHWVGPIAVYICAVLTIPIYSFFWAGRYRPPLGSRGDL